MNWQHESSDEKSITRYSDNFPITDTETLKPEHTQQEKLKMNGELITLSRMTGKSDSLGEFIKNVLKNGIHTKNRGCGVTRRRQYK